MEFSRRVALVALTGLVQLPFAVATQQSTETWLTDDPRLQQKVSVYELDILTGELVQSLAKQTGIALACSPKNRASGVPLSCLFAEGTIFALMQSLASALSYRNAPFAFRREKVGGTYCYTLERSGANRDHVDVLQRKMHDAFKAYLNQQIQYAQNHEDAEIEAELKQSLPKMQAQPLRLRQGELSAAPIMDAKTARMLRFFVTCLPDPTAVDAILKGEPFEIASAQLSPALREQLPLFGERSRSLEKVSFHLPRDMPSGYLEIDSNLFPDAGVGGQLFGLQFERELRRDWLVAGDTETHPQEKLAFRYEGRFEAQRPQIYRILAELHKKNKLNVLFLGPAALRSTSMAGDCKPTLEEFLWLFLFSCLHKWNHGTLILALSSWHLQGQRSLCVNFEAIQKVKQAQEKETGLFALQPLTEGLLELQTVDFAYFEEPDRSFLRQMCNHLPLWRYCRQRGLFQELSSEQGIVAHRDLLAGMPPSLQKSNLQGVRLKLLLRDEVLMYRAEKHHARTYQFWFYREAQPLLQYSLIQYGKPAR
ncbi:hypothetical protein [Armatimonas rosea]|uniref:Uncharacterized protein n=1 Tax=Armatimonas rosea TaxID=685828 RepID=A0A7W9W6W7_ARMRO|nr:hypothetical protein [Armatimonas rosea]MBB6050490.1 hypothetical protein [Armatimonas rosea]